MQPRTTSQLATPALLIDLDALNGNLRTMSLRHPGTKLRPHTKAHKCTNLANLQSQYGHKTFTCATPREIIGMAAAGVGQDYLLANEVVDPNRLNALAKVSQSARVTIAVDSETTVMAAARAGLRDVLIDVNVGLPRCGIAPALAGQLADFARTQKLNEDHVLILSPFVLEDITVFEKIGQDWLAQSGGSLANTATRICPYGMHCFIWWIQARSATLNN